jgi:aminoglycoside phosphotransferase (APT) family kinase protein
MLLSAISKVSCRARSFETNQMASTTYERPIEPVEPTRRANLPRELIEWIESTSGGQLTRAQRLPGGNRREAWAMDVTAERGSQALFLRYDPLDPATSGDQFTIGREAAFYDALRDTEVAIPRLRGVHPRLQAMLVERVSGRSDYAHIKSADDKREVSLDFMRHLARLHRINVAPLQGSLPQKIQPISSLIREEIEIWDGLYRQTGRSDPLIEFGLLWLLRNIPAVQECPAIVHGDAGPGNFLFENDKVTALLDWELAHLGDPLEDIAWLSMRTVLEPFPDFAACLREYENVSERKIDRARVRFHRVLVEWRIAVIRHRNRGEDVANSLISRALNRRLLMVAIAEASSRPLPAHEPVMAPPTQRAEFYETSLAYLRDVVTPAIADPFALAKVKGVARIIKYLKESDRLGQAIAQAELSELDAMVNIPSATVAEAQEQLALHIRSGKADDEKVFAYLARHVGRDTQLMSTALGGLAWRPFPVLEHEDA